MNENSLGAHPIGNKAEMTLKTGSEAMCSPSCAKRETR